MHTPSLSLLMLCAAHITAFSGLHLCAICGFNGAAGMRASDPTAISMVQSLECVSVCVCQIVDQCGKLLICVMWV